MRKECEEYRGGLDKEKELNAKIRFELCARRHLAPLGKLAV